MAELLRFEIAGFSLVFARLGTMLMLLPGFGDEAISPRIRLIFALLISLVAFPAVARYLPAAPSEFGLLGLLMGEIAIGAGFGLIIRTLFSALVLAGSVIGLSSGLAAATLFDPTQGAQSPMLGRFLALAATLLIFAGGLHHLMLEAIVRSYMALSPGSSLPAGDFATLAVDTMAASFALGLQLAAPFLVYALVFNVGLGLMARLTPSLQVFFIAQPLNILLGFALMLATMGLVLTTFIARFTELLDGLGV